MKRSKKNPPYPYYLHEHNYITQKEEPMMPIIDGWQTFKITSKCEHCGAFVTIYVKGFIKKLTIILSNVNEVLHKNKFKVLTFVNTFSILKLGNN